MAERLVRSRGSRTPHRYKWFGGNVQVIVPENGVAVVGDRGILCPSLSDSESQGDTTIERIILSLSTRRVGVLQDEAVMWLVSIDDDDPTTAAPSKIRDPLDVTNPVFTYGSKDLLLFGALEIPPIVLVPSSDVAVADTSITHQTAEFRGRRKLGRLNHSVNIWIAASSNDQAYRCFVQSRILLRY